MRSIQSSFRAYLAPSMLWATRYYPLESMRCGGRDSNPRVPKDNYSEGSRVSAPPPPRLMDRLRKFKKFLKVKGLFSPRVLRDNCLPFTDLHRLVSCPQYDDDNVRLLKLSKFLKGTLRVIFGFFQGLFAAYASPSTFRITEVAVFEGDLNVAFIE